MIDMPARAGAASEARGGARVISAEGADLGAVTLDLGVGLECQEGQGYTNEF